MLQVNQRFPTFAYLVILCVQVCSALDLRNSNTPDIVYIRNYTSINDPNFSFNVSTKESVTKDPVVYFTRKKWQVGKVSRKQYEIINMLWRKTNIFGDEERTLTTQSTYNEQSEKRKQDLVDRLTPIPDKYPRKANIDVASNSHSSTISYIEFYYLDESVDSPIITAGIDLKENIKTETKMRDKANAMPAWKSRLGQFKNLILRSPLFAFRLNGPSYTRMRISSEPNTSFDKIKAEPNIEMKVTTNNFLQRFMTRNISPQYIIRPSPYTKETPTTTSTIATPSDRVKFFEMYDSNTRMEVNANTTNSYKDNEIGEDKRIALEQVDKDVGHGPNKIRYAKKHVKGRDMAQNFTQFVKGLFKINNKRVEANVPLQTGQTTLETSTMTPAWDEFFNYTSSSRASGVWSKYPFAAVYVYERYQVHCDVAAISPYWLVASAACISRHREDPDGDRSAFIAYCGENWWNPERIAYVKYTLVHPRYHPKDPARRHLYNIGVIQVASSMTSSCPGFEPVTIMSHQYVTELTGSFGSAVGWGLNRYDPSYASPDLPRHFLSVYESNIYSNDCPGNSGYRNTKRISEHAVSNVYCLALPAYYGESSDPVHGGLLLVGGKLIALYLQEERRRWGDQSAQYTGVWRLVPWVLDVAKDPEEMDFSLIR